jgi:hypothetical protein
MSFYHALEIACCLQTSVLCQVHPPFVTILQAQKDLGERGTTLCYTVLARKLHLQHSFMRQ